MLPQGILNTFIHFKTKLPYWGIVGFGVCCTCKIVSFNFKYCSKLLGYIQKKVADINFSKVSCCGFLFINLKGMLNEMQ